jgi:hypothetical protein
MARKPSNPSRIEQLRDQFEPVLKATFLYPILDATKRAELA